MDIFTSSGSHRLVSLKCGHIFGKRFLLLFLLLSLQLHCFFSCIEKWLQTGHPSYSKCPQCNNPAKKSDIRVLYIKSVTSVFNEDPQKESFALELQKERQLRLAADRKAAELMVSHQILVSELEYAHKKVQDYSEKLQEYKKKIKLLTFLEPADKKFKLHCPLLTSQFTFVKSFDLSSANSKVF